MNLVFLGKEDWLTSWLERTPAIWVKSSYLFHPEHFGSFNFSSHRTFCPKPWGLDDKLNGFSVFLHSLLQIFLCSSICSSCELHSRKIQNDESISLTDKSRRSDNFSEIYARKNLHESLQCNRNNQRYIHTSFYSCICDWNGKHSSNIFPNHPSFP